MSHYSFTFDQYTSKLRANLIAVCDYPYATTHEGAAALATLKNVCETCQNIPSHSETAELMRRYKLTLEQALDAFTRTAGRVQHITALDPDGGPANAMLKPGLKNQMVAYAHAQLTAAISHAHFMTRIRADEERASAVHATPLLDAFHARKNQEMLLRRLRNI